MLIVKDKRCTECGLPLPRDRCQVPGCPNLEPATQRSGPRSRDEDWAECVSRAVGFNVLRTIGCARYEQFGEYPTLAAARGARRRAGKDPYGRSAMIYAIVPGRTSIFVE